MTRSKIVRLLLAEAAPDFHESPCIEAGGSRYGAPTYYVTYYNSPGLIFLNLVQLLRWDTRDMGRQAGRQAGKRVRKKHVHLYISTFLQSPVRGTIHVLGTLSRLCCALQLTSESVSRVQ